MCRTCVAFDKLLGGQVREELDEEMTAIVEYVHEVNSDEATTEGEAAEKAEGEEVEA